MRLRIFGKPRWPWKAIVVTPADRAPLVMLNRYPGQVIGIAFRLPSEPYYNRLIFKQLSILWARPDVRQYPPGWEQRAPRSVLSGAVDPVIAATMPLAPEEHA